MRGRHGGGKFCVWPLGPALVALVAIGPRPAAAERAAPAALYQQTPLPDVPKRAPTPFAVMAFENRSPVASLDWMSAGIAFQVGEKSELNARLRPVFGPLVVPADTRPVAATEASVGEFARRTGARWVWTGWFGRPDWDLELGISLWTVDDAGKVVRVGEVRRRGDFKELHQFVADAVDELSEKAGAPLDSHARRQLRVPPTRDFYAFTLFGRGVDDLVGVTAAPDLGRAEKSLKRSVFIDPDLAPAWRMLAALDTRNGKPQLARAHIARALEIDPRYAAAVCAQADTYRESGDFERAAELYEKAVRLRPWDLEPRFRLGAAYWELSRVDDAYRELSRVVAAEPDHVRARRYLVMIHAAKGESEDLVRELEQVERLAPKDVGTKMDLAAAQVAVGKPADARRTYQRVLTANPKNIQALKFLGDLSSAAGDRKHAIEYYQRAIQVKPTDPRPYFLLGALYVEDGNDRAARAVYQRALRFKKYQPELYNNLGAIAYREGRVDASLWYLKRSAAKAPNRARYRYNYALSLSASGAARDALVEVDASLKLDPDAADAHYLRGVVLLRLGRAGDAQGEFEKTLALDPNHDSARHNLEMLEQMERRAREGEIVIEGR